MQVRADVGADAAHALEQPLGLDGLEHRLDGRAGHRAAAEGGAEGLGFEGRGDTAAVISSAAQGKPLPSALARREHVGHDPVEVGRERRAGAPDAALHLIEDEAGTDFVAARAQGARGTCAEIHRAGEPLHGLDDHRGGVRRHLRRAIAARSPARHEAHVEGRAREAVPLLRAPQVTAPAAAVRPWKLPSMATTCARPVMRNAIFRAFSLASAPLLTRNTLAKGSPEKRTRRAAARSRTCIATALVWN